MFYQMVEIQCARKGISITKLTQLLGLSSSVITGWKKGAVPRMSTVKMIADFFRISPELLLKGDVDSGVQNKPCLPDSYHMLTDEERNYVDQLINLFLKKRGHDAASK